MQKSRKSDLGPHQKMGTKCRKPGIVILVNLSRNSAEEAQKGRLRHTGKEFTEMAEEFREGLFRGATDGEGVFRAEGREATEKDGGGGAANRVGGSGL